MTEIYRVESVVLESSEDAKSEIEEALCGCRTSFACYQKVIEYLRAKAAPGPNGTRDNKYHFIDERFSRLTVTFNEGARRVTAKFTDTAIARGKSERAKAKAMAVLGYLTYLESASSRTALVDCYGEDTFKRTFFDQNDRLVADLATLKAKAKTYIDNFPADDRTPVADPDGDLAGWNTQIDTLIQGATPAALLRITKILATRKYETLKQDLADYLNDVSIPMPQRVKFAVCVVEALNAHCRKAPQNNKNKTRAYEVLEALGARPALPKENPPGTPEWDKRLLEIQTILAQDIRDGGVDSALQFSTALLYSNPAVIVEPALLRLKADLLRDSGLSALQGAKAAAFVQSLETESLFRNLIRLAEDLLRKSAFNLAWADPNDPNAALKAIPQIAGLKLHVFYEIRAYAQAMSQKKLFIALPNSNAIITPLNSIDTPLVQFGQAGNEQHFEFINCGDFLYLHAEATAKRYDFTTYSGPIPIPNKPGETKPPIDYDDVTWKAQRAGRNWFNPSSRVTYVPLYMVAADRSSITTQVMWLKTTGLGEGLGRADTVAADHYYWSFDGNITKIREKVAPTLPQGTDVGNLNVQTLADFLELDSHRCFDKRANNDAVVDGPAGYKYALQKVSRGQQNDEDHFVLCSTPYHHGGANNNNNNAANNGPVQSNVENLGHFRFSYYRKVKFGTDADGKVVKSVDAANHRPLPADAANNYSSGDATYGVNLPIAMNIPANYTAFRLAMKNGGVVKNKGGRLESNANFRQDAGKVMAQIIDVLPGFASDSKLPATTFAEYIFSKAKARDAWQKLKNASALALPTAQEWCHLKGHGDSGEERVGNFVSGSFHCNTEQLAIECGHRHTTQKPPANTKHLLNATGYLLPDESMAEPKPPDRGYLFTKDTTYLDKAYTTNFTEKPAPAQPRKDVALRQDDDHTKRNAPLGSFIRYKIYRKTGQAAPEKLFDYVFEGQSEFFDKNQYNILYHTVRLMLDPADFYKTLGEYYVAWLKDGVKAKRKADPS